MRRFLPALPVLPHSLYLLLRVVFVSWLTPLLALLVTAVFFLLRAVLPHEPSEANIVQAFNGFQTEYLTAGPIPGIGNITKKSCAKVTGGEGYLCELQYTMQRLSGPPVTNTNVHLLFPVGGGSWGQQAWTPTTQRYAAAEKQWRDGHALWSLIGYTLCSVFGALLLCGALPAVPWNGPGMNLPATPWLGRSIRSGSRSADNLADSITRGANTLTPAGAMALFSLALSVGGFMVGAWVVPEAFIDLRYIRWIERMCLFIAGISWAAVAFCLPMLIVRIAIVGVAAFVMYAVLVLPVVWISTGSSPGQTLSRNMNSMEQTFKGILSPDKSDASAKAGPPEPRKGFEGYRQLAW